MAPVHEPQPHLFDGRLRVHAPGRADIQVTAPVARDAVALAVRDAVGAGRVGPGRRCHAPQVARFQVLQQEPLARRVGDRVVGPGRELIQAAVQRPGVTTASLGDVRTEAGAGEHVDPRPGRALKDTHIEAKLAALGHELALRDTLVRTGAGGDRQRRDRGRKALFKSFFVLLAPLLHVVREGPAIGIEMDPRQGSQRAQLVGREFVGTQHVKADIRGAGLAPVLGAELFAQGRDITLQGHQVRGRFGVHDHQIASHTGPRPHPQCLHQRAQQAHALRCSGRHQHDGSVTRDAEAPQQAAVADVGALRFSSGWRRACMGHVHHDGRAECLDRREALGSHAQLAQPNAGQRGRHQRGAFHRAVLAVLVDHRVERDAVVRRRGAKGQADLAVRWQPQPHRQRAHGIEAGVERQLGRGLVGRQRRGQERGKRLARIVVAAEPAEAVGLHPQGGDGGVGLGQKVRREQALFGGQARLALEHERLLAGSPARAQKQVRKSRMGFVGARFGERDLERRQQLEIEPTIAQVAQLDLAEFDVVFGTDPDGGVGVDLGPGGIETHTVGVVGALVVRRGVGRGVLGQRHGLRLAIPTQIEEAAMGVAQRVVAPACDAGRAPAAPAGTVGAQRHAVAAVGQQVGGRECGHARQHFAQQPRRAALLCIG